MKNVIYAALFAIAIVGGAFVIEGWDQAHQHELALKACGSEANIKQVNAEGFECKELE